MKHQITTGLALGAAAAASVLLGDALGLELVHVTLLGLALGAALVLVPDRTLMGRIVGLGTGVLLAWLAFGLRAGLLPDTDAGRAVAFTGVLVAAGLVSGLTFGRLPLWSLLVGMAAVSGAYEYAFAANTPLFTSESVVAVTSVVLTTLLGAVIALLTTPARPTSPTTTTDRHRMTEDAR